LKAFIDEYDWTELAIPFLPSFLNFRSRALLGNYKNMGDSKTNHFKFKGEICTYEDIWLYSHPKIISSRTTTIFSGVNNVIINEGTFTAVY